MRLWQLRALKTARGLAACVVAMSGIVLNPLMGSAAEVDKLAVTDRNGVYQLALEVTLNAPSDAVHYVITDYAHINRLDPSIVEASVVGKPGASVTRVKTLISDCVLTFCQKILRVEDVREVRHDDIYGVVVRGLGNVRAGTEHWRIRPVGYKTRINYDSTLVPGFFVPPVIGSHMVENKLQEEALICFNNIERIARIHNKSVSAHGSALR